MSDLPPLLDNAVLLVADVDNSITEVLKRTTFDTRIVAYAEEVELPRVVDAVRKGASNYVRWPEESPALVGAVRNCLRDIWSNSNVGAETSDPHQIQPMLTSSHRSGGGKSLRLTRRENEILKLVSEGNSSVAIGEMLNVSMRTIETHRSNVIRKFGVANMTEAVRFALRHGLLL